MGKPHKLILRPKVKGVNGRGTIHKVHHIGGFPGGAFNFLMAFVPNEQDLVSVTGEAFHFIVNFGHQRAGSVEGFQRQRLRFCMHSGADAVRGKHQVRAFRDLGSFINKDGTPFGEGVHNIAVMHDLFAHVDGRPVLL